MFPRQELLLFHWSKLFLDAGRNSWSHLATPRQVCMFLVPARSGWLLARVPPWHEPTREVPAALVQCPRTSLSGCDGQCACGSSEVTEVTDAKALCEGAPVFLWILNVRTRMPTRHRSRWRIQTTLENLEFNQTNKNYIWKTELFCSCVHLIL